MKQVKIIRIDDKGFNCKPYNSNAFCHSLEFIDSEIKDLNKINQPIKKSSLYSPEYNNDNWSGCFCFLDEFNPKLLSSSGALAMRYGEKINIKMIPSDALIWVRNCSYMEMKTPFFSKFCYSYEHENNEYWSSEVSTFSSYKWVKMRVDLALERTRLWKERNDWVPEWITEFYLMESQLFSLKNASIREEILTRINYTYKPKFQIFKTK